MAFAICAVDETDVKLLSSKLAVILYALATESVLALCYCQKASVLPNPYSSFDFPLKLNVEI